MWQKDIQINTQRIKLPVKYGTDLCTLHTLPELNQTGYYADTRQIRSKALEFFLKWQISACYDAPVKNGSNSCTVCIITLQLRSQKNSILQTDGAMGERGNEEFIPPWQKTNTIQHSINIISLPQQVTTVVQMSCKMKWSLWAFIDLGLTIFLFEYVLNLVVKSS